jgi:type IX secretion system substrate protein
MKKTALLFVLQCICLLAVCGTLFAQPVIVNTMPPFTVGTTDSIYTAPASVAPGGGGSGITWNLSALTPSAIGTISAVTPSSTPYISTFPTATFCAKLSPISGGSAYIYERISSTKWEQLANDYAGVGTGTDYTPNPESSIEFPMSYLNSFVDTFQKVGGGANTVTITYDGYGTLMTPFGTYTNVARIYKYWGPGDYDYNWYETSPNLGIVVSFDAQSNAYTLVREAGATSGIKVESAPHAVTLFPNPFTDRATLKIDVDELRNASVTITDVMGNVVKQIPLVATETTIQRDDLSSGIYLYHVCNNGFRISNGRLIIQ